MADDRERIISAFDNMPHARTRGMLPCRSKVLTTSQQQRLVALKADTVKDNHAYLSQHPEVGALVELLLRSVLRQRPRSVRMFVAKFFRDPDLEKKINDYAKVRVARERDREHESLHFAKRTDELTKWRTVLRNSRENEEHVTKRTETKREPEDAKKLVEFIKTRYLDSVCELFLNRPQYTADENNLLRERVGEFLKKHLETDEEVNRLMEHYDAVFRAKETLRVVECVLGEMLDRLPDAGVAATHSAFSNDSLTLYNVPDTQNVDSY